MKKLFLVGNIIFTSMLFVFADVVSGTDSIWGKVMTELINPIFTLLIVITFTYFLWGMVVFIYNLRKGASDTDLNNGKSHMLWGGFGLLIIMSIAGIIKVLSSLFDSWFQY